MWVEFDALRTMKKSRFNGEQLFIEVTRTVVDQLRILQQREPNTPELFRGVSSSCFSKDVGWSL
jgi:hypothetical protein